MLRFLLPARGRSIFNPPDGFNPLSGLPFLHPPGGGERDFTPKKHSINKGDRQLLDTHTMGSASELFHPLSHPGRLAPLGR